MGVPRKTITDIINNAENSTCGKFGKTFEPILYATWKQLKQDNDLYLKAWNSQESIADIMEVAQPTIVEIIKNIGKARIGDFDKTFEPFLYATWKQLKQDNDLYLKAWNSQESIADIMGVTHKTVSNIINSGKKARTGDFTKTFEPFLFLI